MKTQYGALPSCVVVRCCRLCLSGTKKAVKAAFDDMILYSDTEPHYTAVRCSCHSRMLQISGLMTLGWLQGDFSLSSSFFFYFHFVYFVYVVFTVCTKISWDTAAVTSFGQCKFSCVTSNGLERCPILSLIEMLDFRKCHNSFFVEKYKIGWVYGCNA